MTTITHPDGATVTPTKRPTRRANAHNGASCKTPCAGGNKCVCVGGVPHSIHCCKEPRCECRERLRASGTGVSR